MDTPEPDPSATPAPEPKRRRRKSTAAETATPPPAESTGDTPPKPRRKRKTKAEKEAARAAKQAAASRIDPKGWMLFGLLLLLAGLAIYIDPIGFEEAGRSYTEPWVKVLIELLAQVVGKRPVAIILGGVGAVTLGIDIHHWLKERISAPEKK